MKLIIIITLICLTSCSQHYITKGRKNCDRMIKNSNNFDDILNNEKEINKIINYCSYYYDEAH